MPTGKPGTGPYAKKDIKKRSSTRRKVQSPVFVSYRNYLKNTDPMKFLQDLAQTGTSDSELQRVILDYLQAHPSD